MILAWLCIILAGLQGAAALAWLVMLTNHVGHLTEVTTAAAIAPGPPPGSPTDPITVAQMYGKVDAEWIS